MKKAELEAYFIKEVLNQMEIEKPLPGDDFNKFLDMISILTEDAALLERQRIVNEVESLNVEQIKAILEG